MNCDSRKFSAPRWVIISSIITAAPSRRSTSGIAFPQWHQDEATGGLRYDFKTPEGLRFRGTATPAADEIRLEFTVVNDTTQTVDRVEANCCLAFNDCPELAAKWHPENIFAVLDGTWQSFDKATPTASEIGRQPWFLSLRAEAARTTPLPRVSPTWWMIDQHHTENLMGAVTRDGRHLVGYTWSVEPIGLMSNGGNPCLHTGMGDSPAIAPGKSFTWWGKIYLLPNNPQELMKRYRADQAQWRQRTASLAAAPLTILWPKLRPASRGPPVPATPPGGNQRGRAGARHLLDTAMISICPSLRLSSWRRSNRRSPAPGNSLVNWRHTCAAV